MKTTVTTRVVGHCPSHAKSELSVRDLTSVIDEPIARGGTNKGFSPTETVIAALVGCTNVIGHKCAEMLAIDIGHLDISAACQFDRRGVTLSQEIDVPFQKIVLTIQSDGSASSNEIQQVAAEVAKYCPLAKLFREAGTIIEETWTPKSAAP
jgi:putative redox protein